jgi:hypothetical protein
LPAGWICDLELINETVAAAIRQRQNIKVHGANPAS